MAVKKGVGARGHALYSIWYERKQRESLCEAWAADFWAFAAGVGERPSPTHLLRPIRYGDRYGPENFEWLAALKRNSDETRQQFNARKWASRRERFPTYEAGRGIRRKYGITPAAYAELVREQDGRCAICRKPESRLHPKTHAPQLLAVDHSHASGQVRGLLCWGCNITLGKFEEQPELLRAMMEYLETHRTALRGHLGVPAVPGAHVGRAVPLDVEL